MSPKHLRCYTIGLYRVWILAEAIEENISNLAMRTAGSIWHAVALLTKVEFFTLLPGDFHFPHRTHQIKALQISEAFCLAKRFNCPANFAVLFVGVSHPHTPTPPVFSPVAGRNATRNFESWGQIHKNCVVFWTFLRRSF